MIIINIIDILVISLNNFIQYFIINYFKSYNCIFILIYSLFIFKLILIFFFMYKALFYLKCIILNKLLIYNTNTFALEVTNIFIKQKNKRIGNFINKYNNKYFLIKL